MKTPSKLKYPGITKPMKGTTPSPVKKPMSPNTGMIKPIPKKMAKGGNWIQGAIKKPGALREQLGVKKGETIPKAKLAAAAKKGGKLGQRARLAITLGKMRKN
jgi:hypothetical protein